MADSRKLTLLLDMPEQPIRLQSDARALSQILINLINNAIKFTDSGQVHVVVFERQAPPTKESAASRCVVVQVRDTGIGIRPSDMAMLFTSFGRVDSPEVRTREGTGLGLRLSWQLAALLGGTISAESIYGSGSTFTLELGSE